MKRLNIIAITSFVVLAGCSEPTYEQCIRDAVEEGKTTYGIQLLEGLCDREAQKRRQLAENQCYTGLANEFGKPAVQIYKGFLKSSGERCDPSVDLNTWLVQSERAADTAAAAAAAFADEFKEAAE